MLSNLDMKKTLIEKYKDEQVFVVPYDTVDHIQDQFSAVNHKIFSINSLKLYDSKGKYVLRSDAEYNPAFQQLIPYVLISDTTGKRLFISQRIAGEQRLLKDFSLGFGGHINPCDGNNNVIMNAFHRELKEEVKINIYKDNIDFMGHVRDLKSSTSDHLGFVFIVKATKVSIRENKNLIGQWMSVEDLEKNYSNFESWSKHIINWLYLNKEFLKEGAKK